ncbi:M48 family metallopeptidase [Rhodoferax sp.]|uniref:M48 family metallopeptidase n=1 Tax=Rhodoferax sp. TaxID=50421 RepID=UPI00284AD19B|nr:M48 family metallopeptidase [Rhodoferax sp.]MDR3371035.1 M48 family metallopeptidase [Rhodoferax sp.]
MTASDHHTCYLCSQRRLLLQSAALSLVVPGAGLEVTHAEGVDVGRNSVFTNLVPAETIERSAAQQYAQMLQQASTQNALAGKDNRQLRRLRTIAQRIIPHALGWNPRAADWRWEVNLIGSKQINAFCMPGGKIAFYTAILDQLKLTDDEVATVMGHEMAHALREHARERMGKNAATGIGASLISQVFGLGQLGQTVTNYGAQLLTLQFSRSDESEADLVGMELAARSGFDPRAGVSLWQKMAVANKGAPPQWLSTHPAGTTRIADIESNLPKVLPLYSRAKAG